MYNKEKEDVEEDEEQIGARRKGPRVEWNGMQRNSFKKLLPSFKSPAGSESEL